MMHGLAIDRVPVRKLFQSIALVLCSFFISFMVCPEVEALTGDDIISDLESVMNNHTGNKKGAAVTWQHQGTLSKSAPCIITIAADKATALPGETVSFSAYVPAPFRLAVNDVDLLINGKNEVFKWKQSGFWESLPYLVPERVTELRAVVTGKDFVGKVICSSGLTIKTLAGLSLSLAGPASVLKGQTAFWTAQVGGGTPPYNFYFRWGDGSGNPFNNVDSTAITANHSYQKGNQSVPITVEVTDSKFAQIERTQWMKVIEPLTASFTQAPYSLGENTMGTWKIVVSGGLPNFEVSVRFLRDFNPSGEPDYEVVKTISCADVRRECMVQASFVEEGNYAVEAEVADQQGVFVRASTSLIVKKTDPKDVDDDQDGYTENQGDCKDDDAAIYPGAAETCNEKDDNCDGQIDEGVKDTYYRDGDGDGHGNINDTKKACTQPPGYVTISSDCNDSDAAVFPGAAEVCGDGIDQDCDGQDEPCACDPPVCCSERPVICGDMCIPIGYDCCMGGLGSCPPGQECCAMGCCPDGLCCGNACCQTGAKCCPGVNQCCLINQVCCPGGCCDAGETCCGSGCCPPGTYCCQGGTACCYY